MAYVSAQLTEILRSTISSARDAEVSGDRLVGLGVPRSALILETESRNTRENAINTAAVFRSHSWRNGLLVTSSIHMPRALAAFRRVGLRVTPAATGMQSAPHQLDDLLEFRMDKEALLRS